MLDKIRNYDIRYGELVIIFLYLRFIKMFFFRVELSLKDKGNFY